MRKILLIAALVLAVIGPYLYHKSSSLLDESGGTASGLLTRLVGGDSQVETTLPPKNDSSPLAEFPDAGTPVYPDGPGLSLVELLRFDVKAEWVRLNWTHVTELPGTPLGGMRVPLVTGSDSQHVVGSVSYYFNSLQQLERIAVHGFCEDPTSVLMLVEQRFGLKRDNAAGPNTYVAFYDRNPISFMRLIPSTTHVDGELNERTEIDLELNLPRKGALLSGEKLKILFSELGGGLT